MYFTGKLIIDDIAVNILHYNVSFYQKASENGKPSQRPIFSGIEITIEVNKKLDLGAWAMADYLAKQLEIELNPVIDGGRIRRIKLFDAHLVTWKTNFSAIDNQPMSETLFITAAGVEDSRSAGVYSAKWRKTFNNDTGSVVKPIEVEPAPVVTKVHWINPETKELLKETHYAKQVALRMKVDNPISTDVEIHIRKKDGTAFESGQKTLVFSETLDEEGVAELETLEIKEQWEDYKTSDIDQIVAKVVHSESTKDSEPLEIVPPPKVIVDFRPKENYDGEYGFDYMRDVENKGDGVTYKEIMGTNFEYNKEKKKWVEKFKKYPDDDKYNELKDCEYQILTFPWYKDDEGNEKEYIQSWMTIYPDDEHTLSVQVDTIDNPKELDLTLEYDTTYFQLSTDKIPAQKKGKKRIDDHLTIKCLKEFETDQTIKVMYDKRQLGQLNIWANAKSERNKVEVVFVKVRTQLTKGNNLVGNTTNKEAKKSEREMLERYLKQTYIKLDFEEVEFDLTAKDPETNEPKYPDFNKDYTLLDIVSDSESPPKILNKYHNTEGGDSLAAYMEKILNEAMPEYKDYFKVFFFGDRGGRKDEVRKIVPLAGYAKGFHKQSAVMYAGRRKATVTHELLHCLGLRHSFDDRATYGYKKKATENIMDYSTTRTHTWFWQWKLLRANRNLKKE